MHAAAVVFLNMAVFSCFLEWNPIEPGCRAGGHRGWRAAGAVFNATVSGDTAAAPEDGARARQRERADAVHGHGCEVR